MTNNSCNLHFFFAFIRFSHFAVQWNTVQMFLDLSVCLQQSWQTPNKHLFISVKFPFLKFWLALKNLMSCILIRRRKMRWHRCKSFLNWEWEDWGALSQRVWSKVISWKLVKEEGRARWGTKIVKLPTPRLGRAQYYTNIVWLPSLLTGDHYFKIDW